MRGKTQIKERIVKQKGTSTDDLGNSQPIQIAKNANINRVTVRKLCFGEKAKVVVGQPFASAGAIKGVTHGSTQSPQQKPGIDVELFKNNLTLLFNGMSPYEIYGRLTKF